MNYRNNKLPISVLIPAKNEEINLPDCLKSVAKAEQIILVDSQSEDRSVEIAKEYGAEVIQFYYPGTGPKKKNWSLEHLDPDNENRDPRVKATGCYFRHDWVLIVDCDERITEELWQEIASEIENPSYDGYYLKRKIIFLGKWLRHGGKYPDRNLRLFKRQLGRYEDLGIGNVPNTGDNEVHEHVILRNSQGEILEERTGYLKEDMLHIDFRDIRQWIDRHNRYSTWEAAFYDKLLKGELPEVKFAGPIWKQGPRRTRLLRKIWIHLPLRSFLRFILVYVFLLGFLDGRQGYIFACLISQYEYQIGVKLYELRKFGSASPTTHSRNGLANNTSTASLAASNLIK